MGIPSALALLGRCAFLRRRELFDNLADAAEGSSAAGVGVGGGELAVQLVELVAGGFGAD